MERRESTGENTLLFMPLYIIPQPPAIRNNIRESIISVEGRSIHDLVRWGLGLNTLHVHILQDYADSYIKCISRCIDFQNVRETESVETSLKNRLPGDATSYTPPKIKSEFILFS